MNTIDWRWKILRLDLSPEKQGHENVVHRVHWRLLGSLDVGSKLTVDTLTFPEDGNFHLPFDPKANFLPFGPDIDQSVVEKWISAHVKVSAAKRKILNAMMARLGTSTSIGMLPPWDPNAGNVSERRADIENAIAAIQAEAAAL